MRILETKVYTFDELSEKAQAKALDHCREWSVDDGWWEFLYDDYTEKLKEFGYAVKDINFSGFWSQGDGAKFNGHVVKDHDQCLGLLQSRACDLATRVRDFNAKCRLLGAEEIDLEVQAKINSSGHYEHSGYMTLDAELYVNGGSDCYDFTEHPLRDEADALLTSIDKAAYDLFDAIRDEARGHADDIYRDLEKEYEWLTSDEQVAELIRINDREFTEDGELV